MRGEVIKLGMAEACGTHYICNNLQFYFICVYVGVGVGVEGVCGWGENSGNYACAKTVCIVTVHFCACLSVVVYFIYCIILLLMHIVCLFVNAIHVWHPHFPLNEITFDLT